MAECTLLHAMLPVSDLERSLAFYAEFFGLREIRRIELELPTRTLVFLGTASADPHSMQLELWYEPGQNVHPTTGHIGIGVKDIAEHLAQLRAGGVPILKEAAALRPGGRIIAVVADPDGHEIELLS